jgi:hypothetical protein
MSYCRCSWPNGAWGVRICQWCSSVNTRESVLRSNKNQALVETVLCLDSAGSQAEQKSAWHGLGYTQEWSKSVSVHFLLHIDQIHKSFHSVHKQHSSHPQYTSSAMGIFIHIFFCLYIQHHCRVWKSESVSTLCLSKITLEKYWVIKTYTFRIFTAWQCMSHPSCPP